MSFRTIVMFIQERCRRLNKDRAFIVPSGPFWPVFQAFSRDNKLVGLFILLIKRLSILPIGATLGFPTGPSNQKPIPPTSLMSKYS